MEHDRSSLHQSSEPTVCGSDGTAEAGEVNSGNPSDLGANLVLNHADTDDCQAQAFRDTTFSALTKRARAPSSASLNNKLGKNPRVSGAGMHRWEAVPRRHSAGTRQAWW